MTISFRSTLLIVMMLSLRAVAQPPSVSCNQLGFYPNAPKTIIVTGGKSDRFYVVSVPDNKQVIEGKLTEPMASSNSGLVCQRADVAPLSAAGNYKLVVPGLDSVAFFSISPAVNREVAIAALKGFYYQRASMPLEKKYAGEWARPEGHPDTAVLVHASAATKERPEGTVISTPGGWYDAGDYNKYIVNSGITMGTLLSAYEDFPDYFDSLSTNIPESGNGIPDLLDELLYNLRWMLSMQDPADGGVYTKCTEASFCGMEMPDKVTVPRYVVQKSTAAALDFTAVMAQASRVFTKYKKQLPGLSDSCLNAAVRAWSWSTANPSVEYNQDAMNKQFKPAITTGGYGDRSFKDEWYWASVELYITTGNGVYADAIRKYNGQARNLPAWPNVGMLGGFSLIRFAAKLPLANELSQPVKDTVLRIAGDLVKLAAKNAFGTVIGGSKTDFTWGSNSLAANQGWLLINAFFVSGDTSYLYHALSNIDYLLGRNATGYSFVTGIGRRSTQHPHHRLSVADGIAAPVPGLLAGGPNAQAIKQDKCTYSYTEPETMYTDESCSYASNEIAINWNAPLVYLAAALEALMAGR
ncbi:MAG: cellulase [Citrobacter freundii]|nr:MAG: cellulase [Citrobacter freundii]